MKYTQEQIDKMSDHEINLAVAKKNFVRNELIKDHKTHVIVTTVGLGGSNFNPCKTWNDVMLIAEKYDIGVYPGSNYAYFSKCLEMFRGECQESISVESTNKNLRRAICEVFLMMDFNRD